MITNDIAQDAGLEWWEQYYPTWLTCPSRDEKLLQRSIKLGHTYGDFYTIPDGYEYTIIHKPLSTSGSADPYNALATVGIKLYKSQ